MWRRYMHAYVSRHMPLFFTSPSIKLSIHPSVHIFLTHPRLYLYVQIYERPWVIFRDRLFNAGKYRLNINLHITYVRTYKQTNIHPFTYTYMLTSTYIRAHTHIHPSIKTPLSQPPSVRPHVQNGWITLKGSGRWSSGRCCSRSSSSRPSMHTSGSPSWRGLIYYKDYWS